MKKYNGYMVPSRGKNVKGKYKCTSCGKVLEPKDAYCYVDPNNFAITNNAPPYCRECYREKYGE